MIFVTLMSRGQASVQLKMVRQRQTPDWVLKMRKPLVGALIPAVEDEAGAFTMAAGPTNSLVQVIGQAVVQAAQRMHLVVLRSVALLGTLQSFLGAGASSAMR